MRWVVRVVGSGGRNVSVLIQKDRTKQWHLFHLIYFQNYCLDDFNMTDVTSASQLVLFELLMR